MNDHDSAYDGLVDGDGHGQWAFGTSFDDPLAGVDTTVPDDVDLGALARYCLMLGDDALVSSQRLAEWSTRAPELEEEVALANVGLDLIGQARLLLARAAAADSTVVPFISDTSPVPAEDALAFFRDQFGFRNVRLVELANGDFAHTVVRLLVFSTWRLALFDRLRTSRDPVLAAVANKGVKELTYHRDYAARWVVTLGAGTAESKRRTAAAPARDLPVRGRTLCSHPGRTRLGRSWRRSGSAYCSAGVRRCSCPGPPCSRNGRAPFAFLRFRRRPRRACRTAHRGTGATSRRNAERRSGASGRGVVTVTAATVSSRYCLFGAGDRRLGDGSGDATVDLGRSRRHPIGRRRKRTWSV